MSHLLPMNLMRSGELGRIAQISGQHDDRHRLEELGLRAGAPIEMVQTGSPCIVRLEGHKLCIRSDELVSVLVELERWA